MTPAKRRNFERLLNPRHIAFIGGTDAAIAIGEARRAGFAGQMWVVNPKRDSLSGLASVPRIADLPAPPDAVFLAIRASAVPQALRPAKAELRPPRRRHWPAQSRSARRRMRW